MLHGANFIFEGGKSGGIPKDCVQVAYIQGTGTQYIDTGVRCSTTDTFECSLEFSSVDAMTGVFGSRNITGLATYESCNVFLIDKKLRLDWVSGDSNLNTADEVQAGMVYDIEITRGSCTVNGRNYTASNRMVAAQKYNFCLFDFTDGAKTPFSESHFKGKLFYARLKRGGSVMFDLVPVRRVENGRSIGYLCDRKTGTLYGNAGKEEFIIGPDVVPGIPEGCIPVEYLESQGGQYINTGVVPNTNTRMEIRFSHMKLDGTYRAVCASRTTNLSQDQFSLVFSSVTDNSYCGFSSQELKILGTRSAVTVYEATMDKTGVSIPWVNSAVGAGTVGATFATKTLVSSLPLFMFGRNTAGTASNFSYARIYWCRLYDGAALVRNFVPVKRAEGGVYVGYMCDILTGTLYGNRGSAFFIIGPDAGVIDYYGVTTFEIDIPEPNRTFRFGYATSMTAGAPLGGLIDWGDGTTTELKTLAYSNAYYFYQTSTSDYAGELGTHTYAQAGRYTIRVTGDVKQLNPCVTTFDDADVGPSAIICASFKRTNAVASSAIPFAMTNAVMSRLTHAEYMDVSRVYQEGDTARRTVPASLASPNIVLKRIYFPRVDYLAAAFMTDNTHTKDVHFTMNTMDDVFNFKTTAKGTTKWNFAEVDKGVVFHCKDGDIKFDAESGEWKGFLKGE